MALKRTRLGRARESNGDEGGAVDGRKGGKERPGTTNLERGAMDKEEQEKFSNSRCTSGPSDRRRDIQEPDLETDDESWQDRMIV